MNVPAYFHTRIYISPLDRLRILFHGRMNYRGEVLPDPGPFEVKATVDVPRIFPHKLEGYEQKQP